MSTSVAADSCIAIADEWHQEAVARGRAETVPREFRIAALRDRRSA